MEQAKFTPIAYDFTEGYPFTACSTVSTAGNSDTTAFNTGLDNRDKGVCIVCGVRGSHGYVQHCHIIPKVEPDTWAEMKNKAFIPSQVKAVQHESRNGIMLCPNHHTSFDGHEFYIRWMPETRQFIFVNHSRIDHLEKFHGHAVQLVTDSPRLPFAGAFLVHEMRVRGRYPFCTDRAIELPIHWQQWIVDPPAAPLPSMPSDEIDCDFSGNNTFPPDSTVPRGRPTLFVPTNPFANPQQLEALKSTFAQQPTWKAAIVEGETWEGTAEENVTKWRGLVGEPS